MNAKKRTEEDLHLDTKSKINTPQACTIKLGSKLIKSIVLVVGVFGHQLRLGSLGQLLPKLLRVRIRSGMNAP